MHLAQQTNRWTAGTLHSAQRQKKTAAHPTQKALKEGRRRRLPVTSCTSGPLASWNLEPKNV